MKHLYHCIIKLPPCHFFLSSKWIFPRHIKERRYRFCLSWSKHACCVLPFVSIPLETFFLFQKPFYAFTKLFHFITSASIVSFSKMKCQVFPYIDQKRAYHVRDSTRITVQNRKRTAESIKIFLVNVCFHLRLLYYI